MATPNTDPESISEIVRASVILLIQLNNITFGEWIPEATGDLLVRSVTMQVVAQEVLKGNIRQQPEESFELRVQQRGTGSFRVMDYYGLWSHVVLIDGARYVAFCRGDTDDATDLLNEPDCEQLLPADAALEDIRAALALERQAEPNLMANTARAESRGDVFARYLLARTFEPTLTQADTNAETRSRAADSLELETNTSNLEALITLLENPNLTESARALYLTTIYEQLGLINPSPSSLELRLIRAMLRLLILPEAENLHSNIAQVYLPNLLGLEHDSPRYSLADIFAGEDDERQSLIVSLRQAVPIWMTPQLSQWLNQ